MRGISFLFFISAAVYVMLGMVFGIWMSASHDHSLAPAHGHLNLIGWVSMGLFGLYYHAVPRAASTRLATLHFALATLGVWLLVPGIALAIRGQTEILAVLGSFVTVAAMVLFVIIVARNRAVLA